MKILNFERFEIYVDREMQNCVVQDVREAVADIIYQHGVGIRCLDLAMRVLKAEGDTEYSDEEAELIMKLIETYSYPFFIVSLRRKLDE